jgi:hypothetical protein
LERLGHDTQFEKEVHANMSTTNPNFEDQRRKREEKDKDRNRESGGAGAGAGGNDDKLVQPVLINDETLTLQMSGLNVNNTTIETEEEAAAAVPSVDDMNKAESDQEQQEQQQREVEGQGGLSGIRKKRQYAKIMNLEDSKVLMNVPGSGMRYFKFDQIISDVRSQEEVYVSSGLPVLDAFLQGYSACMLVYGQTGRFAYSYI